MDAEKLAGDISAIKERLERMDKDLFGNGQPGIIKDHENRLGAIEHLRSQIIGGVAIVMLLAEIARGWWK